MPSDMTCLCQRMRGSLHCAYKRSDRRGWMHHDVRSEGMLRQSCYTATEDGWHGCSIRDRLIFLVRVNLC